MLEEVLRYVNNRFDRDAYGNSYGVKAGAFDVVDGSLELVGVPDGQYFWVEGSVLNDGLHRYPADDMEDETFEGRVVLLRVPRAVVELAEDIDYWCYQNAAAIDSPLKSESFGGYSYTVESGGAFGDGLPAAAWQAHFGARLRPYRKLSRDWV